MTTQTVFTTSQNVCTILNWSGNEKHTLFNELRELASNPGTRHALPVSAHSYLTFNQTVWSSRGLCSSLNLPPAASRTLQSVIGTPVPPSLFPLATIAQISPPTYYITNRPTLPLCTSQLIFSDVLQLFPLRIHLETNGWRVISWHEQRASDWQAGSNWLCCWQIFPSCTTLHATSADHRPGHWGAKKRRQQVLSVIRTLGSRDKEFSRTMWRNIWEIWA